MVFFFIKEASKQYTLKWILETPVSLNMRNDYFPSLRCQLLLCLKNQWLCWPPSPVASRWWCLIHTLKFLMPWQQSKMMFLMFTQPTWTARVNRDFFGRKSQTSENVSAAMKRGLLGQEGAFRRTVVADLKSSIFALWLHLFHHSPTWTLRNWLDAAKKNIIR